MEKWISRIDAITTKFMDSFGDLSREDLNWKPDPQTWSIAQNVDHLINLNRSYFPTFENLKKGSQDLPFIARFGFVVSFFGNMIKKSVEPDRKKKMKTFPMWEPSQSDLPKSILHEFQETQDKLKGYISDSVDFIHQNMVISSPANRNIVYKLETAFDIIVSHEERHYNQAKEVLSLLPKT
ncbi:DinB family protein [Gramella jeungdoensis]|uniref:DinB family protein n=1 Tax=Gramella jeungdoensis TaxID=708091 RepID=A0ABT0Z2D9_9FLAO|nr:DinB family protein [Gramella jeungdoensis]MCM8569887.1 DinB family protein [Gramella jeungdoensis]